MREEIARVVPFYEGVQRLKTTGDAFQYGGPHLCAHGKFPTTDGKAHFRAVPFRTTSTPSVEPNGQCGQGRCDLGLFVVSTRRGKQFNSLIYGETDPLNGAPRDAVLMNPLDAHQLQVRQNDRIRLKNDVGTLEGCVFLAPIARR